MLPKEQFKVGDLVVWYPYANSGYKEYEHHYEIGRVTTVIEDIDIIKIYIVWDSGHKPTWVVDTHFDKIIKLCNQK